MKKILFTLVLLFTLTLASCQKELDYSDFEDQHKDTHLEIENIDEERYIVYYYSEVCPFCEDVKADILEFANEFDDINIYFINSKNASDDSAYANYKGTPTVFVIENNEVVEEFRGVDGINDFIMDFADYNHDTYQPNGLPREYADLTHIDSYDDFYTQEEDEYIVYFYSETCGYCNQIKDFMFDYAAEYYDLYPIYFVNAYLVTGTSPYPGTGTPTIYHVKDGELVDRASGAVSVPEYLTNLLGDDAPLTYEYSDFQEYKLTKYADSYTASANWHYVYVYSVNCSHCQAIKQDILGFFDILEGADFFLIDVAEATDSLIPGLTGTPTLYLMNDSGEIVETFVGSYDIPAHIDDYNNGNVTFD